MITHIYDNYKSLDKHKDNKQTKLARMFKQFKQWKSNIGIQTVHAIQNRNNVIEIWIPSRTVIQHFSWNMAGMSNSDRQQQC